MADQHADALTIAAVGDFMLERRLVAADIEAARGLFRGADIVIANLDTVLSERGTAVPKWANLRGPRAIADDLRALGVDVAVLANNHAMDFRAEGMLDCRQALAEAGVRPLGAGADLAEAAAPVVIETRQGRVAVVAISCTLPPESAAGPDWPGVAPMRVRYAFVVDEGLLAEQPGTVPEVRTWLDEGDLARVRADVAKAGDAAEVVLVVVHWGVPGPWRAPSHPQLQAYQRQLGHALIDAGAHAVLGNHAHELHGIEFYRERPIAYCLGNFWIDTMGAYPWMGRESVVLRVTCSAEEAIGVELSPLLLDDAGVPRLDADARAIAVLKERGESLNVVGTGDEGLFVVAPAGGR